MRKNGPFIVFYDGKCGICVRVKKITEKLDKEHILRFIDLWEAEEIIKGTTIKQTDLAKEIHLITGTGEIYRGYFALKYIVTNIFWLRPFRFLFKLPLFDVIGVNLYKVIARNRLKLITCADCQVKS